LKIVLLDEQLREHSVDVRFEDLPQYLTRLWAEMVWEYERLSQLLYLTGQQSGPWQHLTAVHGVLVVLAGQRACLGRSGGLKRNGISSINAGGVVSTFGLFDQIA